jgi:hypothetical protein
MNPLMRALTGPILLATLGVLLTIDYLGSTTIGRTWPVLLIVFGLCKVLEYAGVKGPGPGPDSPSQQRPS